MKYILLSISLLFLFLDSLESLSQPKKQEINEFNLLVIDKSDTSVTFDFTCPINKQYFLILNIDSTCPPEKLPDMNYDYPRQSMPAMEGQKIDSCNILLYQVANKFRFETNLYGLKNKTKYHLLACSKSPDGKLTILTKVNFITLSVKPTKQGCFTSISDITSNSVKISKKSGDGIHDIIIAREMSQCEIPKNGQDYRGSINFTKGEKTGSNTYILYYNFTNKQDSFEINYLKPNTKYYFAILESNGNGAITNFLGNLDTNCNLINFMTKPEFPRAMPASSIDKNSFTANWKKTKGVINYVIDIATDYKFENIIPEYNNIKIGKIDSLHVEQLPESKYYYYRLKVICDGGESIYSNIIEVPTEIK